MNNLYFPICAVFINILILIVFYSKKRFKGDETRAYSYLIITAFLESSLACILVILMNLYGKPSYIYNLHRIDYILMLFWTWALFNYVSIVSINNNKKLRDKLNKITLIFNVVISISFFFLKVNVINENGIIDTNGEAMNVLFFVLTLYVVLIIILVLKTLFKNFKSSDNKKFIPLLFLAILGAVSLLIRSIAPEVLLISLVAAFADLIMFFTIENPDKKLLQEIHASKKMADEANEEKSMLIYNMMGEIKDIAKDINISSNNILDSNNIEENKYYAREIISSNNKLYNMSDKIYNIDKIELNKIKTVKTKYNIKLLLKEIVSMYKTKIEAKNIEFRINIDNNLPVSLYGDSINLKKALSTIIDSSYNNTKEGFIELSVNTIIKHDVCRLIIKIEDSSIGIKAEEIEELNTEGNIYNAKKLIAALGGTLLLTSRYNEGTIVTIILDQKINITNKKEKKDYTKYLDNKKILLVDDNESSLKLINKIL